MLVTREKTEQSQAWLTIEMTPEEVQDALGASYKRLVKQVKVPGFRKGKAPRAILERHLRKESLLDDAIDNMLPEAYRKAIEEQSLEPIAQPEIEIVQNDPLIFKAVVPLPPTVELGDYHSLKLTLDEVKIDENEVASVLEQLRHQKAVWQPVERAVEVGDLVVMDIESHLGDKPFLGRKGMQYQVLEDSPFPAPGFSHELVGTTPEQEKEFTLKYPEDDSRGELAGKEVSFKVRICEIKEEILPELDDALAKEADPEVTGLEPLRDKITLELKNRAEQRAREDFETRVCDEVVSQSKVEFPPVMVAVEIDRIIDEQLRRWQQELDTYLGMINKTEQELRDEIKPVAEKRVSRSLALAEVAKKEEIAAGDEDINAEIENLTKGESESQDKLNELFNNPGIRRQVEQMLVTRKTLARLTEIAQGTSETTGTE
ncbi:MAG: trigger factor [Dehalococcoidales bacterium]|jgi:trigger factor